jgi:RNA polymerase sigma factor (sigma-70 family)
VSALVSYFGLSNIAVAEDIVHDTFVAAIESWKDGNEPHDVPAWLFRVCKNKTINYLDRQGSRIADTADSAAYGSYPPIDTLFLEHEIPDNQLRLLFACCDSRISPKSQVILLLKHLCGLRIAEIANGLLMSEEAVTKSLSRSRETLSEGAALTVPLIAESKHRLGVVHTAIYLMFSEGYAATTGPDIIRQELCIEAMRLMKSIIDITALRNHDSFALMALMCFHSARFDSRVGTNGELIELESQDRSRWDKELIRLGITYLQSAHDTNEKSRFIYEAAIASVHCVAEQFEDTNWEVITGLYTRLSELQSTPFNDLNKAVAVFYSRGGDEALSELEKSRHLSWLRQYYLYYALLGKICAGKGQGIEAIRNYEKALSLSKLDAEKDFLKKKITTLKVMMN